MKTLFALVSIFSSFSAFAGQAQGHQGDYCAGTASEGAKAIATVNGAAETELKEPSITVNNPDQGTSFTVTFGKRVYNVETIALDGDCKVVTVTTVGETP